MPDNQKNDYDSLVLLGDLSDKIDNFDFKYNILLFIQEFTEAFIIYSLYKMISSKDRFDFVGSLKISAILGLILFFLENFNSNLKQTIKSGLASGLGNQFIKLT
jgi:hypothetical protein